MGDIIPVKLKAGNGPGGISGGESSGGDLGAQSVSCVWGKTSRSLSDPEPRRFLPKNLPRRDSPGKIGKIHPKRSLTKRLNAISLGRQREKATAERSQTLNLGANPALSPPSPWGFTLLFPAFWRVYPRGARGQAGDGPSAGDIHLQTRGEWRKRARGRCFVTPTRGILQVWWQPARVGSGREADIRGEPPPLG